MTEAKTYVAELDEDGMARLEEALDVTKAGAAPAVSFSEDASGLEAARGVDRSALEADAADLIATYKRGINVAAHIESRPLIPLFEAASIELPPELKVDHEKMGYEFYLAEVTFSVMLDDDERLRSAAFELRLSDDVTERARQVRPVRLFPGRKDVDLFSVELEGAVGVDTDFQLSVPREARGILPFAAAAAEVRAGGRAKMVAGPYSVQFRRAAIEVKGESDPVIFWRYKLASELAGRNDFKSILVLKVAREATRIEAEATLEVIPLKRRWLLFEKILPALRTRAKLPIELAR